MPELTFTASIDEYPNSIYKYANTVGVWELWKTLRAFGVGNSDSLLLIRRFGLKQSRRHIMRELGMKSNSVFALLLEGAVTALQEAMR